MDDFRRVSMKSGYSPMPPRSRSERVGPRSRSRSGGGGGRKPPKTGWKRFLSWKWLVLVLVTSLLLMVGGCSAIMLSEGTYDLKKIQKENMPFSSKLYDANDEVIATIGTKQREWADIEQLKAKNPMLVDAFVKTEDRRFYKHIGVDFEGLSRAVVKNIIAMGAAEGASTITQQVCKNIILENAEKTMTRKIKELGCALNLEKRYSKDDILEAYLNFIGFGGRVAGVRLASKVYFGKDPVKEKLEPQEVAMLAGMPKAPNKYNPLKHPEKAIERRNVVLTMVMPLDDVMEPMISEEEAKRLAQKPLDTCKECEQEYLKQNEFDAYKDLVIDELEEIYGLNEEDLEQLGLNIYTGLNLKAQKAVEEALKDDSLFTNNEGESLKGADAGITIIDPKTGLIRAVGGGREYKPGYRNRAVADPVQPGSTIKPLTVYSPAIQDLGYNEYFTVEDKKVDFAGDWNPSNYSGGPKGEVSMKYMVANSLNLSTIHLLREVGLERAYNYGQKLGLDLQPADKGYAPLALGGLNKGVTSKQMAQAYSVFPNKGSYKQAYTIRKVVQGDKELEPKKEKDEKETKVFDEKTAYWMTRMLKNVITEGSGKKAALHNDWDVAGKTGTIQGGQAGWFVGYTPNMVMAVNVFYPQGGQDNPYLTGGSAPAKIFGYVMNKALEGEKPQKFQFNAPEPQPPFELKQPQLSASQQSDGILLKWGAQGDRVKFQVWRAEEGQDFQMIKELPGTVGEYKDPVQPPQGGNFLDNIFGGGGQPASKTYRYKVVAIDTEKNEQKESGVVSVTLAPKGGEKPDDGEKPEDPNNPGNGDDNNNFPFPGPGNGDDQGDNGNNGNNGDNGNKDDNKGGWPW
ncbi:transglycosylase domain-containing protein [Thermoactinomyces intermedius]|jgi:penicillin-binding protein 2A|uniref:Transglycosylase domain-containing protein n=1 Tax=Thermoactinomyces intermedius TaxID=2024 RepID=A0A8I1A5M8_THEIN|nr:transglycosylase domain-containing protein [Thermoactinomyces intermedius]MBA4548420.1 transglycosylase domain-containing protein [Thermoactinomyces intermedius]MBA4837509.1 transglycosylase domain-containing protein [Thermoactinomyces intermedius]MBH8595264.1 transglycosylase domain-containing protein [Thermoactinomyces intermedius]